MTPLLSLCLRAIGAVLALAPGCAWAQERPPEVVAQLWLQGEPHCWAVALGPRSGALLAPSHCVEPGLIARLPNGQSAKVIGELSFSRARDYAILSLDAPLGPKGLSGDMLASERARSGMRLLLPGAPGDRSARVLSATGPSVWLSAMEPARFCPGDSGRSFWSMEQGKWRWSGMLLNGSPLAVESAAPRATRGCDARAGMISVGGIAWGNLLD